jgi:hypothetical protein
MSPDWLIQLFIVCMAVWTGISILINVSDAKADKAFAKGLERGKAIGRAERSRAE